MPLSFSDIQAEVARLWNARNPAGNPADVPVLEKDGMWSRIRYGNSHVQLRLTRDALSMPRDEFSERVLMPAMDALKTAIDGGGNAE